MVTKLRRAGQVMVAWLTLSRPPFHSVGILPFILGAVLAWWRGHPLHWAVLGWGTAGVVSVMLATYYAGEYWDYAEDTISGCLGGSRFAGGSQVLQEGGLPRHLALWGSVVSALLALGVAAVLQFGYQTGGWTLLFAAVGLTGGVFYSTRPVRWVSTGFGELWIAFCYGWLPVAVGYYLQTERIDPLVHWLSIPIGLTIFNVILLNEFPDYPADREVGKTNLLVRIGRRRGALLYSLLNLGAWGGMGLSLWRGVPLRALWVYGPVVLISAVLSGAMLQARWRNRATLEVLCGVNLVVNLGTTGAYLFAFCGGLDG